LEDSKKLRELFLIICYGSYRRYCYGSDRSYCYWRQRVASIGIQQRMSRGATKEGLVLDVMFYTSASALRRGTIRVRN
jgi:hypothetical protein